jgi:hypothetical protein
MSASSSQQELFSGAVLHALQDPFYLSLLAFGIAGYFLLFWRSKVPEAKIPYVGLHLGSLSKRREAYVKDAQSLINEGYQKIKNGVFQMATTEGTRIVAGQKFYHALCDFNDEELSFTDSIADVGDNLTPNERL